MQFITIKNPIILYSRLKYAKNIVFFSNRNNMKLKLAVSLTLMYAVSTSSLASSLVRIYELAVKNDSQYQRAISIYEADSELSNISRAKLYPSIKAEYALRYLREDNTIRQVVVLPSDSLQVQDVSFDRNINYQSWALRLEQPIFDAPAWYGYQQGKSQVRVADAILQKAKQDLVIRVVNAYIDVLRAQDSLAATRAQEGAHLRQLEKTKQRFASRLIPITEVTESQAAYDVVRVRSLEEQNNVEITLEAIGNITGSQHTTLNILSRDFEATQPEPNSIDKWTESAINNNLQLLIARQTQSVAENKQKAAEWEHSPKVVLGVFASNNSTGGSINSSVDSPFILGPDQNTDSIGIELRLQIPLYEGGLTSANIRRAGHQFRASRDFAEETSRSVSIEARKLFLRIKSDVSLIEAKRVSILSAKSALDAAEAGYGTGTRNIIDVLNAQNVLFSTERDYANSRYDYIENSFLLRANSASLTAGDIFRLDAFLKPPSNQQGYQRAVR
jgi:outer membrane protein